MTEQHLKQLLSLLYEYFNEQSKTCNYDCYNCDLGILEGRCSIETVIRNIEEELYP